jgi:hypothetical protein
MPVNEMNQAKAEEFAERMIGILNSGANVARSRLYRSQETSPRFPEYLLYHQKKLEEPNLSQPGLPE